MGDMGGPVMDRYIYGPRLTDWQLLEALRMRDAGATYKQIADDLGRTPAAWWKAVRRVTDATAFDR